MKPPRIIVPALAGLLACVVIPVAARAQEPAPLPAPHAEAAPAPLDDGDDANDDDVNRRTGERIHRPPGYAPARPQPFLKGVPLYFVQFVAALGARGLLAGLGVVPCLGIVTQVLSPGAEALGVLLAGDRLGPYRSSLFWPVVASYGASALTLAAAVLLSLGGMAAATLGSLLLTPASLGVATPAPLLALSLGLVLVGTAALGAGTVAATLGTSLVSPLASVAAYHLSRKPKRLSDNGTGLPLLLPRSRGPRIPFITPRVHDDDEDCGGGSLPVRAQVAP